ncbi:MAG TPA: tetratricopeptide repeat protein [Myxococcota bacterium]|nr:tetratricopeptide repeat protein [Myxococcota bacterium]
MSLARANAAIELRRWDDAVREAGLAIAANPNDANGYYALARGLWGLERNTAALEALGTASAKRPEWFLPHVLRSDIERSLGWPRKALAAAEEAVRLGPHSAAAHIAVALSAQKVGESLRARSECERALELAPQDAWIQRLAGDVYLAQKQNVLAEKHYRQSLAISAADGAALNNLALVLNRQGKTDEALDTYRAAIRADPTLRVAKRNLRSVLRTKSAKVSTGGLFFLAWIALYLGAAGGAILAALGGTAALALLAYGVARLFRPPRVSSRDPELRELQKRLDADHKAGRL